MAKSCNFLRDTANFGPGRLQLLKILILLFNFHKIEVLPFQLDENFWMRKFLNNVVTAQNFSHPLLPLLSHDFTG